MGILRFFFGWGRGRFYLVDRGGLTCLFFSFARSPRRE